MHRGKNSFKSIKKQPWYREHSNGYMITDHKHGYLIREFKKFYSENNITKKTHQDILTAMHDQP